jgi:hypothetical protein
MSTTRLLVIAMTWMAGLASGLTHAQVELDRIVARVGGRVVTQSDVRQAMLLKLGDDVSSEAAAQRGLEDRWLMLEEVRRGAPLPPTSEGDFARRRAAWEQKVGGASAATDLLAKASMSEAALQAWLRDDLRIEAYLARQFAGLPETDRSRASRDWVDRLRQRARLK